MIKLLTAGGFGDAAISFAKISSKDAPFDYLKEDFSLTHIGNTIWADSFRSAITEFYNSQKIEVKLHLEETRGSFYKNSRKEFDHYLGTHWSADNMDDESSWEINPFPHIIFEAVDADIVVSPFGGWNGVRKFSINHLRYLSSDRVTWVGKCSENENEYFNTLSGKNLMNKMNIKDLINVIASSNIVVAQDGFTAFFAALCGKKVYMCPNSDGLSAKRVHPDWDLKILSRIEEVVYE